MKLLHEQGIQTVIGMDYSINALNICKKIYQFPLLRGENRNLPIKTGYIDIVVSWGSLHYCKKNVFHEALGEIYRIIKKGGILFGTLRSENDTYLKRGRYIGNGTWITNHKDITDSVISFYNKEELVNAMGIFNSFQYGIMERTLIGDTRKVISHWFFWAEK